MRRWRRVIVWVVVMQVAMGRRVQCSVRIRSPHVPWSVVARPKRMDNGIEIDARKVLFLCCSPPPVRDTT